MAPAVASSVINPLIRRPFSAALIAETLAGPTAAPMVRASAGTRGGMLVRRRVVPASIMGPGGADPPPRRLADAAEPHHFEQFLARDEAVNVHLRALIHLPDP